jgi:hypothetical protein
VNVNIIICNLNSIDYSNLNASIGFSLAAFLAGIIPKSSQIEIEEITAINTDFTVITA